MPETKSTFPIKGMHCNGCANLVRDILSEDVAGVRAADVRRDPDLVELTYDDTTDLQAAAKLLQENGYTLVLPDNA